MPNFLDKIILPLWPALAVKRLNNRIIYQQLSVFDGAKKGPPDKDWPSARTSADGAIVPDNPVLDGRARNVCINHWAARSAQKAYRRNVVGTGITAMAAAIDPFTLDEREEFNKRTDWLWKIWVKNRNFVDIEKRKSFYSCQKVAMNDLFAVGQAFIYKSYQWRPDSVGLQLQMFEFEQLDTMISREKTTGNEVRHGIEIDQRTGEAVAYHVCLDSHPLDSYLSKSRRLPADRVIHLFDVERVRQSHGFTMLAPVLKKLWNIDTLDQYTLIRARVEACMGGFIKNGGPAGISNILSAKASDGKNTTANGDQRIVLKPGMFHELSGNAEFQALPTMTPSNNYGDFMDAQVNNVGAGVGLDGATLNRDYSKGSYSSQRQGMLEDYKEYDMMIQLMIDVMNDDIRREFIDLAVMEGRLEVGADWHDPMQRHSYYETEWQGPARPWIDPKKEVEAAAMELDYRLNDRREIINRKGGNWRTRLKQIATELLFAKKNNIPLPDDLENMVKNNEKKQSNEKDEEEEKPDQQE
ncbi:MAG: phage portal protein [Phycisphaerae bacterium]|nr:phage portal protein [Phycisphaerae bacterium]